MDKALAACPFCGGTDLEPDWTCALVRCRTCLAEGPVVGWAQTSEARRAAAVAAWNRRAAPSDDLRAELVAALPVLESLLIEIEPVLAERRADIEAQCAAQQAWADKQPPSNNKWAFMTEFRAGLQARYDVLGKAVWRANQAFDALLAVLAKVDAAGEGRGT